ncbi:Hypothetical_protein [Hexamita inflata]|uniref:Hypothetical_protein n=1 Tax=Hexamita inflata TaxID=28002 RepID=A0AA86TCP1_9EUKA|nr:Hypothetical protein HINF_LOCUS1815 [Hexamita inflata]
MNYKGYHNRTKWLLANKTKLDISRISFGNQQSIRHLYSVLFVRLGTQCTRLYRLCGVGEIYSRIPTAWVFTVNNYNLSISEMEVYRQLQIVDLQKHVFTLYLCIFDFNIKYLRVINALELPALVPNISYTYIFKKPNLLESSSCHEISALPARKPGKLDALIVNHNQQYSWNS